MDLKNKVILVTGGSSGIGEAIVRKCSEYGAKVTFSFHSGEERAKKIASETGSKAFAADVSRKEDCKKLVEFVKNEFGTIDVLVNNAGIIRAAEIDNLEFDQAWETVMKTNLDGAVEVTKNVVPILKKQKTGKIVNISSINSVSGGSARSAYNASKAALNSLTRVWAIELAKDGITVNGVAPGPIWTPPWEGAEKDFVEKVKERIPLKRFGQPEEIAGPVAFLASDLSDFMTGQTIFVEGGILINQYFC